MGLRALHCPCDVACKDPTLRDPSQFQVLVDNSGRLAERRAVTGKRNFPGFELAPEGTGALHSHACQRCSTTLVHPPSLDVENP